MHRTISNDGTDRRIGDLLDQLTVAEQIAMLHQYGPAVPRLGLRPFRTGTEALHGVAWLGEATVFAQAVGLGATWNPELLEKVGEITAIEVRAKHAADPDVSLNVWAPVVNLLRDPRWGRNEEGYSEDPLLTSRLAIAYCRGLRGEHPDVVRTAPTVKHFLAYNNEGDRDQTSSVLRARVLREYDLPAFAGPIQAGVVDAVMPSYNLVNGRPAHLSPYLNELLRPWSPHELLVVSDAEAPGNLVGSQQCFTDHETAHAAALLAGVDSFTERSADPSFTIDLFTRALDRGLISETDIERAVRRVLTVRSRTGEFDPAADPYAAIGPDALDRPEHRELAREVARDQVVLLKNAGDLLPLTVSAGLRIAVIGPFAETLCADWYSGTMPYRITIAEGLRTALAGPGAIVTSVEGVDRFALLATGRGRWVTLDPREATLTCGNSVPEDSSPTDDDQVTQFDVFDWGGGVITLRAVQTGRYVTVKDDGLGLAADQVQPNGWEVHETFTLLPQDDGTVVVRNVYTGKYLLVDPTGALRAAAERIEDAEHFAKQLVRDGLAEVRQALRDADVAIVVVGNDPHINGRETQDRSTLALPPAQDALIRAVGNAHPRTALVVMSSYPYDLTWADAEVPAIVWTSHAGQETGSALADILLGRHAPTGRLPQTWYRRDADLPDLLEYDIIKARRTYQYFDGTPLYPFGHGLTYTGFDYSAAQIIPAADDSKTVTVQVDVTNVGDRAGIEVVQVYTRMTGPSIDRPVRKLQGWCRVPLAPSQTHTAEVHFPLDGLAIWDVDRHDFRVDPGTYEVLVGRSAAAIQATAELTVSGEPAPPRTVVGVDVAAADFDDYTGITLVDNGRPTGDAVETTTPVEAWVLFRAADLSAAPTSMTARVSRTRPGSAQLELRTGKPDGPLLATVAVPFTGDRSAWVDLTTEITGADGVHHLYLLLRGHFRLDSWHLDVADHGKSR
ncbi:MAG TPA: glycoside hydrolase family 3 C-terminal domain-containing protein [Kineosporiaceae bacterium]|nr:glycoside hydrolase family 3 C-terminal domain-containing protein [Kineosporiaceae bacterium]